MKHTIMKPIQLLAIAWFCLVFVGCQTKQHNAVADLLRFRTELKANCEYYTADDWEDAIEEFAELCKELDKMDLTREERLEVNKVIGEITGCIATVAAQEVSDTMQDISEEIGAFVKGFEDTFESPQIRDFYDK